MRHFDELFIRLGHERRRRGRRDVHDRDAEPAGHVREVALDMHVAAACRARASACARTARVVTVAR